MFNSWETLKSRIEERKQISDVSVAELDFLDSIILDMHNIKEEEDRQYQRAFELINVQFKKVPYVLDVYVRPNKDTIKGVIDILLVVEDNVDDIDPEKDVTGELVHVELNVWDEIPEFDIEMHYYEKSYETLDRMIKQQHYIKM